jgi:hypothetical protein
MGVSGIYVRWSRSGHDCSHYVAAARKIKGSATGPRLAEFMTAGYIGFLVGPPLIGFVVQLLTIRDALWYLWP